MCFSCVLLVRERLVSFSWCVSGCECSVSVSVITIPVKVHGIRSYDSHIHVRLL